MVNDLDRALAALGVAIANLAAHNIEHHEREANKWYQRVVEEVQKERVSR